MARKKQAAGRRRPQRAADKRSRTQRGQQAREGGHTLRSYAVGGMAILNHFLQRLRLDELLGEHIPCDGRTQLPASRTLLVLVRNILMAREPIYGVREWAGEFAPDLFDLWPDEIGQLGDDRDPGEGDDLLGDVVEDALAQLRVGHLAAPEHDRHLHLVTLAEELLDLLGLGVEVAGADLGPVLHLLDDDVGALAA